MKRTFAIALTLILLAQGLLVPLPLTAAPASPASAIAVTNSRPAQVVLYFKPIFPGHDLGHRCHGRHGTRFRHDRLVGERRAAAGWAATGAGPGAQRLYAERR